MKDEYVRVAYVKEDIDCQTFTLNEGAVFLTNGNGTVLEGFHHGGTDMIVKLEIDYPWMFEGKLSFYDVPENCHYCKYCHFNENNYECMEYPCVRRG